MVTPGRTPPETSVTIPVIAPVACAPACEGISIRATNRNADAVRMRPIVSDSFMPGKDVTMEDREPDDQRRPLPLLVDTPFGALGGDATAAKMEWEAPLRDSS